MIISDYGKGGLGYIQEMIQAAHAAGRPVVVDPKGDDYSGYRGANLITPNRKEFEHVAGRFRDNTELERKALATASSKVGHAVCGSSQTRRRSNLVAT